jgi:hypothetical protein
VKLIKVMTRRLVQVPGLVTLGHYAGWPCAVLALAMRVAAVLWGYAACYSVGALLLPLLAALMAHGSGICTRGGCAVLMSATPTDAAHRYRWWLHHVHHQLTSKATWSLIAVWFVLTFVVVNPIASGVPVVALLALELRAIRLHSRLRPWCRWCNGRGGPDEPPAVPDPTGGLTRPVPPERIKEHAH